MQVRGVNVREIFVVVFFPMGHIVIIIIITINIITSIITSIITIIINKNSITFSGLCCST